MQPNMPDQSSNPLSHLAADGRAHMVDVGEKPVTQRRAVAEGFVRISAELEARIRDDAVAKGSVLEVARLAGILGAKRTDSLIPLCHSVPLDAVEVVADLQPGRVHLLAMVRTHARTGVEMEALTAVAIAALTVIDMGKSIDKSMSIEGLRVLEKHGGRAGSYLAPDLPERPR
ncbi:cyclic pyranopterin monophosphate synthase [Phycisphaerales bacterium]|nr:cyclic pyranopterin monophosphate synthase [Phycisphaerales bacterium]